MTQNWDVIIVGGGHAGAEAAAASARLGARTALITADKNKIGEMSCNPAIGGLGKGHIVREIDALDGIMGLAADAAGIQFRLLNRSKGPAVRGPRAQSDRSLYRQAAQRLLGQYESLTIIDGMVVDLVLDQGRCAGVILEDRTVHRAATVVLTTGTFLGGLIHLGAKRWPAGRMGEAPSLKLAQRLAALNLPMGRLKTGTPARLDSATIDFSQCEVQPGDDVPSPFSFLTSAINTPQLPCHITWTSEQTHKIIRENLHQNPMYAGAIEGRGPRYCPSIEDKIVRFADKLRHQIFLEPEGLDDPTIYPNGISTSFGEDVQAEIIASIHGLEHAKILQWAYAIEYDFVDPIALNHSLMLRALPGLFLAGQINGTTGYEEAAGQGLVAGLNAARMAAGSPLVQFDRTTSYLGVMIDDLVTKGVSEPYRMFTSRAEYRLRLRADNADQRLTPYGIELGLVSSARAEAFATKLAAITRLLSAARAAAFSPAQASKLGFAVKHDGRSRSALDLLSLPDVDFAKVQAACPALSMDDVPVAIVDVVKEQIEIEALYAGYIERQEADILAFHRDEALSIPDGLDYGEIGGLSNEAREKLNRHRPPNIGQALRIEGMTPGAISAVLAHLQRGRKSIQSIDSRS